VQKVTVDNGGPYPGRFDYNGDSNGMNQYPQGISVDNSVTGISVNANTATNNAAGGGQAHENTQPSTVINFIIKY
jgi:microcystin-dependent protein